MLGTHLRPQNLHSVLNKINYLNSDLKLIIEMDQELSEKTYESRLQYIHGRYLAYVDIKPQSSFVLLAIHEHLGLSNYFRVTVQALCGNQISIVIPNLFGEIMDQSNRSQADDQSFLTKLDQSIIAQTLYDVFEEIKGKNKKVIVVGLSIGAAIGLKMLEFLQGIEFSMFFYGLPPANLINPQKIKSKTIIYIGEEDKVKHLSDQKALKQFQNKYQQNKYIEIYTVQQMRHGFMNPASDNYSQQTFTECSAHFQELLRQKRKQSGESLKKPKGKGNKDQKDKDVENKNKSSELKKPVQEDISLNNSLHNSQESGPARQQESKQEGNCKLI